MRQSNYIYFKSYIFFFTGFHLSGVVSTYPPNASDANATSSVSSSTLTTNNIGNNNNNVQPAAGVAAAAAAAVGVQPLALVPIQQPIIQLNPHHAVRGPVPIIAVAVERDAAAVAVAAAAAAASSSSSSSSNNSGANYPPDENRKYKVSVSFDRYVFVYVL